MKCDSVYKCTHTSFILRQEQDARNSGDTSRRFRPSRRTPLTRVVCKWRATELALVQRITGAPLSLSLFGDANLGVGRREGAEEEREREGLWLI